MLNPDTYEFLKLLAQNNDRDWFNANKSLYKTAQNDLLKLAQAMSLSLAEDEPAFMALEPKKTMFRIFRDTRFSKDKAPYKTHFGMVLDPGGTKTDSAAYYLHIEPGRTFIGGGKWAPPPKQLLAIREGIAADPDSWLEVIENPTFKKTYGKPTGDAVKTAPKGFSKDHPQIEWIRLKSFTVGADLEDSVLTSSDAVEKLTAYCHIMRPFRNYLNAVMKPATDEMRAEQAA